jgi:hypothetical protein
VWSVLEKLILERVRPESKARAPFMASIWSKRPLLVTSCLAATARRAASTKIAVAAAPAV